MAIHFYPRDPPVSRHSSSWRFGLAGAPRFMAIYFSSRGPTPPRPGPRGYTTASPSLAQQKHDQHRPLLFTKSKGRYFVAASGTFLVSHFWNLLEHIAEVRRSSALRRVTQRQPIARLLEGNTQARVVAHVRQKPPCITNICEHKAVSVLALEGVVQDPRPRQNRTRHCETADSTCVADLCPRLAVRATADKGPTPAQEWDTPRRAPCSRLRCQPRP